MSTHTEQRTTQSELLSFVGLTKSFFGVRVLNAVSFTAGAARIVGLVGENGAGKST
jgi:ABC-type sugar transport system ATPase subunit